MRTASHAMVADVGDNYGGGIVLSYLRTVGIRHLDALLLSHDDIDHVGGAARVLRKSGPINHIIVTIGAIGRIIFPPHRRCEAKTNGNGTACF